MKRFHMILEPCVKVMQARVPYNFPLLSHSSKKSVSKRNNSKLKRKIRYFSSIQSCATRMSLVYAEEVTFYLEKKILLRSFGRICLDMHIFCCSTSNNHKKSSYKTAHILSKSINLTCI
mmetsp:Transcript_16753/g.20464  ORF Transcript_16753/g.20464 Transcript_16753/m.20464 type:complete len:119 (+) Transcript_16753:195-551(+)